MRVAVASGKGGTGKTTIAANLACVAAASGQSVQYLDCDVEEPNGHVFLKPDITATRVVAVDVPEVDLQKCTGCGKCGELCQYGAIVHLKDNNVLTFEQLCHSCGGCLRVCPADAIRPKPLAIGDIESGMAGDIDFVHGRLHIGHVRTPSLIKEVKSYARHGNLVIIDVPPGTSCPVVEAVKDADFVLLVTEPTPFGLNDLKLAVGLVRRLNVPFAVAVNRHGIGNDDVEAYCRGENIDIILRLPDDRRIAEAYSSGQIVVDILTKHRERLAELHEFINKLKAEIDAKG